MGLQLSKSTLGYTEQSTNSNTYKALGLKSHVTHQKGNKTSKGPFASSLPSYILGGGMLPVPENDIPVQGELTAQQKYTKPAMNND